MSDSMHIDHQLTEYMDDRLSRHDREKLESHLKDCSKCREHWHELKELHSLLRDVPLMEPPPGFYDRVMSRLESKKEEPFFFWPWPIATRVVGMLGVVGVMVMVTREASRNHPELFRHKTAKVAELKTVDTATAPQPEPALRKKAEPPQLQTPAPAAAPAKDMVVTGGIAANEKAPLAAKSTAKDEEDATASAHRGIRVQDLPSKLQERREGALGASMSKAAIPTSAQAAPLADGKPTSQLQWQGNATPVISPKTAVVQDVGDWDALWQSMGTEPAPPVDFNRYTAVAIFSGTKSSGSSLTITNIEMLPSSVVVHYREETGPAMAISQPYLIRLIPKTSLPISFDKE